MTTHTMKWERIPGTLGTSDGYKPCFVKQDSNASVADDDVFDFENVDDVQALFLQSEAGTLMDFDNVGTTDGKQYTVNATTASTYVKGRALIKE